MGVDVTIVSPSVAKVSRLSLPARTPWPSVEPVTGAADLDEASLRLARSTLGLARKEASSLTEDLDGIRAKLRELKVSSQLPGSLERRFSPRPPDLSSVSTTMLSGSLLDGAVVSGLEEGVDRVKLDLDTETRHRVARDQEATHRMELLQQCLDSKSADQREMDRDLRKLDKALDGALQQISSLFEALEREANARQVAEEALQKQLAEARGELKREVKERTSCHEDLLRSLSETKDLVNEERSDRERADSAARSAWQKELLTDREAVRDLRTRFQEAEASWTSKTKSLDNDLEVERSARTAATHALEQRILELSANTSSRMDAMEKRRADLKESLEKDFSEQIRADRQGVEGRLDKGLTSLKDLVNERFDAARAGQDSLRDELSKERVSREAQIDTKLSALQAAQKASLEPLLERLGRAERRDEDLVAHADRSIEARCSALECLLKDSVRQERESREAALEQTARREHASRTAQSDQAREHDNRLGAVQNSVEELGEKLRAEQGEKVRELRAEQTRSSDETQATVREIRQELADTRAAANARLADQEQLQRANAQLEGRVSKTESFVAGFKVFAGS